MNVRLGKFEQWVQERVDSGDYASHAEVIRAGLRLLKEQEEWQAEARKRIVEGLADIQAGRVIDGDQALEKLLGKIAKKRRRGA